jgi:hypothetical protein
MQLLRPPARRDAAIVAELQAKLSEMKTQADKAVELLSVPPIGMESIDRLRERAKEFAEARSRSFGLLLQMLAANAVPNDSAWTDWDNAKRSADTLWSQPQPKP